MGIGDLFKTADQLAEKTLNEFKGVEGLNEVIGGILALKDSEIYERAYETSRMDPMEKSSYIDTVDDLLKLRQVKLATGVLKDPPLYLPFLTDVIISTHFNAVFGLICEIDHAYAQKKLGHEDTVKEHAILERSMSLLDNFNKLGEFEKLDKEFYQKLKKIKWDKTGKKLFSELDNIRGDIQYDRWGSGTDTFRCGENFALTFLAACNAVHHNRDRILKEDMIKAYKTYLKLLNTDITKLM
jgi:hypothetical protein